MKFEAPRILKAPPRWKFSHLKNACTPASESKVRELKTGVLCAIGRMRSAAARMSSIDMSIGIGLEDNHRVDGISRAGRQPQLSSPVELLERNRRSVREHGGFLNVWDLG